jgi:hypothetical protein
VASPWYLKNYFQTGNPFYPLFDSLINSLNHHSVQESLQQQVIEKTGQVSFFKLREIMYGENLWETLLIPVRMFFQGKDTSYQYFQGSLNPILIIFLPFSFLKKRYDKDKIFFVCFTVIFLFMAYFLTAKQVRYILPVLPFLAIIAVMGIKDIFDRTRESTLFSSLRSKEKIRSSVKVVIITGVATLLIFNLNYLKYRIETINPFPYVLGKETKEAFLQHHLLHYGAVEYINHYLPDDAIVFTMFLGRRGYYFDRAYKNEVSFGMATLKQMIINADDEKNFLKYVRSMEVTHILMRTDLVNRYLRDNFSKDNINHFLRLKKKFWKKLYENNGYEVWDING